MVSNNIFLFSNQMIIYLILIHSAQFIRFVVRCSISILVCVVKIILSKLNINDGVSNRVYFRIYALAPQCLFSHFYLLLLPVFVCDLLGLGKKGWKQKKNNHSVLSTFLPLYEISSPRK